MSEQTLSWLGPADVPAMLALATHAAGRPAVLDGTDWTRRFVQADAEGRNLSVGLFAGHRLLAFVLALVTEDAMHPQLLLAACATEPTTPGVRRMVQALTSKVTDRADLRGLAVIACLPQEFSDVFAPRASRARTCDPCMLGNELADRRSYPIDGCVYEVGSVRSATQWDLLEPYWDALLAASPGGAATQTFNYLRTWWRHLGAPDGLWILVVLRDGVPVGIAPFHRCEISTRWTSTRLVRFIGADPEVDKPVLLAAAGTPEVPIALARYLLDHAADWDRLELREQPTENVAAKSLAAVLEQHRYVVSFAPGPLSPVVKLDSDWETYLANRPRELRRNLKRRRRQLERTGAARVESRGGAATATALQAYLALERMSWKANDPEVSIGASARRLDFFRDIAAREVGAPELRVTFLLVKDSPLAATIGLVWNHRYLSMQICHDEAWAGVSPGVLLTALELEQVLSNREYEVYDFLCGFESGKIAWSTQVNDTTHVVMDRATPARRFYHLIQFRLRPRVKRTLMRLGLQQHALRLKRSLAQRFLREGA